MASNVNNLASKGSLSIKRGNNVSGRCDGTELSIYTAQANCIVRAILTCTTQGAHTFNFYINNNNIMYCTIGQIVAGSFIQNTDYGHEHTLCASVARTFSSSGGASLVGAWEVLVLLEAGDALKINGSATDTAFYSVDYDTIFL